MITGGSSLLRTKQISPWWSHPLVVWGAVAAVVLFSVATWLRPKTTLSADPVKVLDQEIEQIASDVFYLQTRLDEATSAAGQEKIVRNELLMAKDGEIVVQLPPLPTPSPSITLTSSPIPIWQEWVNVIF